MPVVDASICGALFHTGDPGHPAGRRWLAESQGEAEPIVAPVILLAEVAAALGRGLGDAALAREAVRLLRGRHIVELFPVTEALATRAAEIAAEEKIRGCDASMWLWPSSSKWSSSPRIGSNSSGGPRSSRLGDPDVVGRLKVPTGT